MVFQIVPVTLGVLTSYMRFFSSIPTASQLHSSPHFPSELAAATSFVPVPHLVPLNPFSTLSSRGIC